MVLADYCPLCFQGPGLDDLSLSFRAFRLLSFVVVRLILMLHAHLTHDSPLDDDLAPSLCSVSPLNFPYLTSPFVKPLGVRNASFDLFPVKKYVYDLCFTCSYLYSLRFLSHYYLNYSNIHSFFLKPSYSLASVPVHFLFVSFFIFLVLTSVSF